ncbi:hypothetical protein Vadar_005394 [Vaccinium darrowii]|uniref:Uncharacterized protein n=1 Tax=Vaccinium darrowii TaxID=229202 RepID=A0ACB7Z1J6_9ERIC|nr:hypothetical protein Vadar_005394 [Vaccinium darrowii]
MQLYSEEWKLNRVITTTGVGPGNADISMAVVLLGKDLIRLKREARLKGGFYVSPEAKLLFIVRIHGINAMDPKTRKILQLLRLRQNCILMEQRKKGDWEFRRRAAERVVVQEEVAKEMSSNYIGVTASDNKQYEFEHPQNLMSKVVVLLCPGHTPGMDIVKSSNFVTKNGSFKLS